jgi:hypothetical protein
MADAFREVVFSGHLPWQSSVAVEESLFWEEELQD